MLEKFSRLSSEKKTLVILLALSLGVFLCLSPLFFLSLYQYPLGWLLGSLIACVCYYSIFKGNQYLLSLDGKKGAAAAAIGLYFLRFALMAVGLILAAVCTFKKEWFGGFDAFNLWTVFAGYLLLFVFVPAKAAIEAHIALKKEDKPDA